LAEVETRQKKAMREGTRKTDEAYRKGKLVEFLWFLKKKGYKSANERFRNVRGLLALGADLWNPESVKRVLATDKKPQEDWTDGYKLQLCYAYTSFCEMEGLTWEMPAYKQEEKLPWIPLEEELDSLISAAGKVLGAYLQGLKDTGTDPGELGNLEWNDINSQNRTVNINRPVKGHSPRVLKVSRAFLDRVNSLPKKYGQYIWSYQSLRANYQRARKSAARRLANPRILQIELRTFRHWKGTMEYHKTKDILHVKQLLGHKRIENTMKYINLEGAIFEDEPQEFHVKVANNVKEAMELVEVGFDYVTGDYEDGGKIFRKRK
jgi:integrase